MTAPSVVYIESAVNNTTVALPKQNATVQEGDLCVISVGGAPAYIPSSAPTYNVGGADAGFSTAFQKHQSASNVTQASCYYKVLTSSDATLFASAGTSAVFANLCVSGQVGRCQIWVFHHANGWDISTCLVATQFASNVGTAPQTVATMTDVTRPVIAVEIFGEAGTNQNALQFTWASSPNNTQRDPYVDESSGTTTTGGHANHYGGATGQIQADYQEYATSDTPGTVTASAATAASAALFALAEFQAKPTSITVGTATETDTAVAFGHVKKLTLGVAVETDTAFSIRRASNNQTLGTATETDSAVQILAARLKSLGVPAETDSAFTVKPSHVVSVGVATETDTAFSLEPQSTRTISFLLSDPGDHGSATKKLVVYAQKASALEDGTISFSLYDGATLLDTFTATTLTTTDTAYILPITGTITDFTILEAVITIGSNGTLTAQVNDVELVLDNEVSTATETDSAGPIRAGRSKSLGTATETDSAFNAIPSHAHVVGVAVEIDTAVSLITPRVYGLRANVQSDSRAAFPTSANASIRE